MNRSVPSTTGDDKTLLNCQKRNGFNKYVNLEIEHQTNNYNNEKCVHDYITKNPYDENDLKL